MKTKASARRSSRLVAVFAALGLLFLVATLIYAFSEIRLSETDFSRKMRKLQSIQKLRSAFAGMSQWQAVIQSSQEGPERYLARRNLAKLDAEIVDSLASLSRDDPAGTANLAVLSERMLGVQERLADPSVFPGPAAYLEFRSIMEICEYTAYALQEQAILETNTVNSRRFIRLVVYLIVEVFLMAAAVILLAFDVQRRKRAEASVARIRNYLRNVIDSISSPLVSVDKDGAIINYNKAATMMIGGSGFGGIGKDVAGALPMLSPLKAELLESLANGALFERRAVPSAPFGARPGESLFDVTSYPLLSEDGLQGAVIRLDDVSSKLKMEEQLRQTQKMNAVGQLAGGVAHDFNNSLAGIIGAAELLKSADISDAERSEYLQMILTAAGRAGELTKKLLLFSHKSNKASSAVNVAEVVNDSAAILRRTIDRGITVSVDDGAESAMVVGDDSLLQNCFMNLGINASHAMPEGGALEFTLRNTCLDKAYCSLSPFELQPGDYLEVAVRDTGQGIAPAILPRIFEPFFTTKEQGQGTGLGLSAVYGTVQDHHGAITVYSELGAGTVFRLYFPLARGSAVALRPSEEAPNGTGTILLVDDEELIRVTTKALLEDLGYEVILAENGAWGVATFAENSSAIDLVLLDMIMPVMGGREAFDKIKAIKPDVPIIVASGFAKEEDLSAAKEQGIAGFLNKPFRRAELARMVAKHIKREDRE